jgi:hypothetical protein
MFDERDDTTLPSIADWLDVATQLLNDVSNMKVVIFNDDSDQDD